MKLSEEPLVSVTVPTYNRPEYLKLALRSAVNQTYKNLEIIVSDNGSPASMLPLVEEFKDPRIRFHRYDPQVTMFDNHIGGFRMATGKYVASLHDDDIWKENFVENLVYQLEKNPELIVAFSSQWVIDEHGKINEDRTLQYNSEIGRPKLAEGTYQPFMKIALKDLAIQPASSAVIRREWIDWENIPSVVGPMWDVYVPYLLAKTGKSAYYTPEKLTLYRIHSQSETGKDENLKHKMHRAANQMSCYAQILKEDNADHALSAEMRQYILYRWQHASTSMAIALMKGKQVREARTHLRQSIVKGKTDLRTWIALAISLLPRPAHPLRMFILNQIVKAHD